MQLKIQILLFSLSVSICNLIERNVRTNESYYVLKFILIGEHTVDNECAATASGRVSSVVKGNHHAKHHAKPQRTAVVVTSHAYRSSRCMGR